MIVMFGASSDIGRRAASRLLDSGLAVRLVSRSAAGLDSRAEHYEGDIPGALDAVRGADVVISCAHASFTMQILDALETRTPKLVLVGSAWRYSGVYEARGHEVVAAEAALLDSGRNGVMLHPTMIYGGTQENNLHRLIDAIHRWPVLPIPGGGSNLVQPIHVDDVAQSIVAAVTKDWNGPHALPICGPIPMRWRYMLDACVNALGYRRVVFSVPLRPAIAALQLLQRTGVMPPIDPNILLRFREDVSFSTIPMNTHLGIYPRDFESGLSQFLSSYVPFSRSASGKRIVSGT